MRWIIALPSRLPCLDGPAVIDRNVSYSKSFARFPGAVRCDQSGTHEAGGIATSQVVDNLIRQAMITCTNILTKLPHGRIGAT